MRLKHKLLQVKQIQSQEKICLHLKQPSGLYYHLSTRIYSKPCADRAFIEDGFITLR